MPCKLTFFYNQYKQGFSETYYIPSSNPALATTTLSTQLLTSLTQFRNIATLLYAVRATNVAAPFTSFTRLIRGEYQGGVQTDPDAQPDIVGTTAVLQLVSENGTKRRVFLRGLPDDYVKRDAFGNDLFVGTFKTMVTKMVAQMIGNSFSVRKQQQPPDGGLVYAKVLLVSSEDNPLFTRFLCNTVAGFTPVPGSKIVFKGIAGDELPGFNRIQTVNSILIAGATTAVTVKYSLPGAIALVPTHLRMSNISYAYEPLSEYTFERFSSHKTGRPFGQLAGKRR